MNKIDSGLKYMLSNLWRVYHEATISFSKLFKYKGLNKTRLSFLACGSSLAPIDSAQ